MELTLKEEQGLRLRALVDALEITQKDFAKRIGLSQGYLNRVLSGEKSISWKMTSGISMAFPEVNQNWLSSGAGEMFLSESGKKNVPEKVEESSSVYEPDPLASLRRLLAEIERRMAVLDEHERRLEALERRVAELPTR